MMLRWFQTYDEHGVNSEIELQYWNEEYKQWANVPFLRVKYCDSFDRLEKNKWFGRYMRNPTAI